MRVALAQLSPALRNTAENVRTVREVLAEHGNADLVVLPELFLSSYTVNGLDELALDLDGPEVESVAQAARENSATVIFGAPERIAAGIANSAICVDQSGDVVGSYRKTHLFGDERTAFVAGDELLIVDIDGLKVGLMICFDVEFPEVARALAMAGLPSWREADGQTLESRARDFGDAILARKDAPASYHLSCVVDDAESRVTTVVRGADLRPSTPVQRLLQILLELPEPTYLHHPLVAHEDGRRLAKRDLAPTLVAMREAGTAGEKLREQLLAGLLPSGFRFEDA